MRAELETIRRVSLLAEWENRDLHVAAFDATYAWSWNDTMHKIAHGRAAPLELKVCYAWNERAWPRRRDADAVRLQPRQERVGGDGVRAVRPGARRRRFALEKAHPALWKTGEPVTFAEGSVWEHPAWGHRVGVTPLP